MVDTNVLMSAIFFGRAPGRILAQWRAGDLDLLASPEIVGEYTRVAERLAQRYPEIDAESPVILIVKNVGMVPDISLGEPVCDDPDDDKFLACALAGGVSTIISGDKQLLAVSGYRGVEVLTPRRFIDRYLQDPGQHHP